MTAAMSEVDLHPLAIATLNAIAASGQKPYHLCTPQEVRADVAARLRALPARIHPGVAGISDMTLAGPAGPLGARRYDPTTVSGPGAIVYAHGGGWVFGAPDLFDPLCSWLAAAAQRPLLSIEYRLAPESRFPGPLEDMVAAVEALTASFGPLVVAGDSAGGNLAAASALLLADRGSSPLVGQILLYPVLDHGGDTLSYQKLGPAGRIISGDDMRWFWDQYAPGSARDHAYAAPLRGIRFDHLPPAYLAVAGWDPLHDEGVHYAERLRNAGVPVTLDDLGDMLHGFCSQAGILDRADEVIGRAGRLASHWLSAQD
jgi:acetyl esterase